MENLSYSLPREPHPHAGRKRIYLNSQADISDLIRALCDGSHSFYSIENSTGRIVVNARSVLGVLYAWMEFRDEMYLFNEVTEGFFPEAVTKYFVEEA